jgi:hypothetical protein
VKHINLDGQNEILKQFFLSLPGDPDGSVVELGGQAVARVLPMPPTGIAAGPAPWTDAKNARRAALIDREIDGNLSAEEASELKILQQEMLRYRRKVAPLPLEATRRLHQELLARARKQTK